MGPESKIIHRIVVGAWMLVAAGQAHAQITYVDAAVSNTTVDGANMVMEPTGGYNMSDDDDAGGDGQTTEWIQRDPFANNGNAFQTGASPGSVVLGTSVSGLAAGTYRVYAYFWDATPATDDWDLAAELNNGGYIDKAASSPGVIVASNQLFTASVLTTEGNRTLHAIDLGMFTGTGFTVNGKGGAAGVVGGGVTDVRTWYDGVGYIATSQLVTYVDAAVSNTTVDGANMVMEPTGGYNMSDDDDAGGDGQTTEWMQRDPFSNNGNAFQTGASPGSVVLGTSVNGLAAGTYRVYAYFWDSTLAAADWDLAAELNNGGYIDKAASSPGVIAASSQLFTASVLTTEGNRTLHAIDLGMFTGTGFTVNGKGGAAGVVGGGVTDVRTWYDGVGYSLLSFSGGGLLFVVR